MNNFFISIAADKVKYIIKSVNLVLIVQSFPVNCSLFLIRIIGSRESMPAVRREAIIHPGCLSITQWW